MAGAEPGSTDGSGRAVAAVLGVVTAAALPVLLVGAQAVQIRAEIPFGSTALGLGFGIYFLASAVVSPVCGRWAQRHPAAQGMRAAGVLAAAAMAGLALVGSWGSVLGLLALAGVANALAQPPSSTLILERVRVDRRALAFGLKQAAIPAATLLGGLAVPGVALTLGWRWAFAFGAAFALAAVVLVPPTRAPGHRDLSEHSRPPARAEYGPMVVLACAVALGTAAANPLGAFVTSSGVERGLSPGAAGMLLAGGSVAGLLVRVAAGWLADRLGGHQALPLIIGMLALGALGYGLMSLAAVPSYVIGVVLGFGAGHAWQGLFNFAVARQWSFAAATAIGVTQTGLYGGSALGPPLFGLIVDTAGDGAAWLLSALLAALAAAMIAYVRLRYLASV